MVKHKKKSKKKLKRERELAEKLSKIQGENMKIEDKEKKENKKSKKKIEKKKSNIFTRDILIENFTISPLGEGAPLIKDSELRLIHGHRYGLIGNNGVGKSTLFRHLENNLIIKNIKGLRTYLVKQEIQGTELSVLETVKNSDSELTRLLEEKKNLKTRKQMKTV